jgi:hypothetical protein
MARTTGGSLRLSEDPKGLAVDADLDDSDPDVQRLVPKLRSGNVSQMSFGFSVLREDFREHDRATPLRILREVELFDVSPVTYPAYPGTDGGLAMRTAEELGAPVPVSLSFPSAVSRPEVPELDVKRLVRALRVVLERPDVYPDLSPGRMIDAIETLNALERSSEGRVLLDRRASKQMSDMKRILDLNRRRTLD